MTRQLIDDLRTAADWIESGKEEDLLGGINKCRYETY